MRSCSVFSGAFSALILAAVAGLLLPACGNHYSEVLTSDAPLHLEEHLDAARIEGSPIPTEIPSSMDWFFDKDQPDWQPVKLIPPKIPPVVREKVDDTLRLSLNSSHVVGGDRRLGAVYIELPQESLRRDWSHVEVRARTEDRFRYLGLDFNYTLQDPGGDVFPFFTSGDRTPLITDGTIQTYRLSLDIARRSWEGPWTHLGLWFSSQADEEASILDIFSVRVIPKEAAFANSGTGVEMDWQRTPGQSVRDSPRRRTLYMHTPGKIFYSLKVPAGGRLDTALGVVREINPVTFSVTLSTSDGQSRQLFEETYANPDLWAQRSIDLSEFSGRTVEIALGADSPKTGAVALWATPTVSGERTSKRPNVILYVIDGGSPDYMSVYGYNRRTTPRMEGIAAQGAIFERAYSNSAWTRPSTPSFLTSLQHSVLGGLRNGRNQVPPEALTMAEHMHRAGYQTALFTTNSNAGRISNLERGTDVFRDAGTANWSTSSVDLHRNFWNWRKAYPGEPYFVHFQTTDVHNDHFPVSPFSGLFVGPDRRRRFESWLEQVNEVPETADVGMREALDQLGIDQKEFWSAYRDLHDECMAHQDYQLGQLVDRLKASGEWEDTLLIVAADHGVAAGAWDYNLFLRDSQPKHVYHDDLAVPILRSGVSRIPFIIVWPRRVTPGQRFNQPVSMIDLLPTALDLTNLLTPEVMMGQSLAPLLLGENGWKSRPVIFDEFEFDAKTGKPHGRLEVVDGRWGASLEIGWDPKLPAEKRRPVPLLLYDLWEDPNCLKSLHQERPDLVKKYTAFLERQWEAHQSLASQFTRSSETSLTPEQLETLRALGYID